MSRAADWCNAKGLLGMAVSDTIHILFHSNIERWRYVSIERADEDDAWISTHEITCPKCSHKRTAYRAWLDFLSPSLKNTKIEAIKKALSVTAQDN